MIVDRSFRDTLSCREDAMPTRYHHEVPRCANASHPRWDSRPVPRTAFTTTLIQIFRPLEMTRKGPGSCSFLRPLRCGVPAICWHVSLYNRVNLVRRSSTLFKRGSERAGVTKASYRTIKPPFHRNEGDVSIGGYTVLLHTHRPSFIPRISV